MQSSLSWLAWKFDFQKITFVKPATGGSAWIQAERPIHSLNNALFSAALCRRSTNTDVEKELSKMKGLKAFMKISSTDEIKEAYVEIVKPALTQLRGQFGNCVFAKKKTQTHTQISN